MNNLKVSLNTTLDELQREGNLNIRIINCLRSEGLKTVKDIVSFGEKELLKIPNFGKLSLKCLKEVLFDETVSQIKNKSTKNDELNINNEYLDLINKEIRQVIIACFQQQYENKRASFKNSFTEEVINIKLRNMDEIISNYATGSMRDEVLEGHLSRLYHALNLSIHKMKDVGM